ncbi:MAG: hypothetical protein NC433_08080 [Clostridiales bacterium]|nr:hypothetical protein [Clostridiales bacterium]
MIKNSNYEGVEQLQEISIKRGHYMAKDDNRWTEEQLRQKASEGYFVRDMEKDRVYCPTGEILRKKCTRKNGDIRYANKRACKECGLRAQCTRSPWKEIDFPDGTVEVRNLNWLRAVKAGNFNP